MARLDLRAAQPGDFGSILELNQAVVDLTSPLSLARLGRMHALAAYHRVAISGREVQAFLLVFREGADYDSENYRWFCQRLDRFLYIDRIVVAARQRSRGHGRRLYEDLASFARAEHIADVVCEYNAVPDNAPSRVFHEKFGFTEMGSAWLTETKRVSYQRLNTGR